MQINGRLRVDSAGVVSEEFGNWCTMTIRRWLHILYNQNNYIHIELFSSYEIPTIIYFVSPDELFDFGIESFY